MHLSNSMFRILISVYVALGSVTYGYCSSIISSTLAQPSFLSYFDLDTRKNASSLEGAINALFQAGGLFGCLSCIAFADILGRRKSIMLASLTSAIGGALQVAGIHIGAYLVFRFVTGLGVGALVALIPLYQSEIAPPRIRGLLVGSHGVMICVGYALSSWIGFGFSFVQASAVQWRIPLAIQCVPPIFLTIGVMFLPESPRWLIYNDRIDQAWEAYKAVSASSDTPTPEDDEELAANFANLCSMIRVENTEDHSFKALVTTPALRKRCIIGFVVLFGCQGTATLVINNYGPSLYKSLGFKTNSQLLIQVGWITISPFGNLINSLLADRVGRTRLLMAGYTGVIVALIGECISVSIFQHNGSKAAVNAAIFFLFFHMACFSTTCDATSYIYASEIFPTPVRARGLAVSISAFATIGWRYYIVFIACTSATLAFVLLYCPETGRKSLEEISDLFNSPFDEKALEGDKDRKIGDKHYVDEVEDFPGQGSEKV
ncbi:hypothetical protein DTO006G1_5264 [Penicillium roqueforti]|nr:hypothetical protein CBS147337_6154 [Penicillium roqueforti]KAI2679015.1 hypothetical protein LCP963914a_7594 [Penicillium roqueforti]KAI2759851.1 hypothetical protein DTO006G1_5264 [Penicillium roqueforti]KAI3211534.1 hypothetical protein DTO027I6_3953 [Penicillium roqueforti]KAI3212106.1 hypothetical protein CBS147311_624 [Penicillium roqueforti]